MAMAKKRRIIDFFPGPLTSSDVDHPIDPISKVKKNHSLRQDFLSSKLNTEIVISHLNFL
jgi:hypothetical protein